MAFYASITVAGILFAQHENNTCLMRAALWMQLLWISSPILLWRLTSGFSLIIGMAEEGPGFETWVGSVWNLELFGGNSWGIGINLFPALMLVLLRRAGDSRARALTPGVEHSDAMLEPLPQDAPLAAQIDSILQLNLFNTPLAHRGIRLQSLPDGGVSVGIGTNQYASVDEVPDEEVRLVLSSAITEWENKNGR
jgi:hypothetical protein